MAGETFSPANWRGGTIGGNAPENQKVKTENASSVGQNAETESCGHSWTPAGFGSGETISPAAAGEGAVTTYLEYGSRFSAGWYAGIASDDNEYIGLDALRRKLNAKRTRVLRRYRFYEMKNLVRDLGISTPPELRGWNSALGWCASAVDSLSDRLYFREFRGDVFDINSLFRTNNQELLTGSAILGALISSCNFVRVYRNKDDEICLENIDGGNATGVIDARTGLLKEGYCVLSRDNNQNPVMEAWFKPHETRYYENGRRQTVVKHAAPWPLLVPVIFRPDAVRPFGHSRISRACMSHVESALRTIKRSEISAEFYSFPQKYVTGLSRDAETMDKWKASMSSFISMTVGDDGEKPSFGQFSQASMDPHLTQLRMFASLFAGETGLTLDDMGFPSENPSSQEAIKAAHENLRRTGKRAQKVFGLGFANAGYLAACIRDDYPYKRTALAEIRPVWEPLFEADAAGLNLIGDGILKVNQAVPGFVTARMMEDMTGLHPEAETI